MLPPVTSARSTRSSACSTGSEAILPLDEKHGFGAAQLGAATRSLRLRTLEGDTPETIRLIPQPLRQGRLDDVSPDSVSCLKSRVSCLASDKRVDNKGYKSCQQDRAFCPGDSSAGEGESPGDEDHADHDSEQRNGDRVELTGSENRRETGDSQ